MRELRVGQVWWALVVDGVRSKPGAALLALGLGLSAWLFATGDVTVGVGELAIVAFFYARIGSAIGLVLAMRGERRSN
jgi:hypothetical protein